MEQTKKILYLFGFSPFQGTHLKNLLKIIKEQLNLGAQITIILIHDGVIGISKKGIIPSDMTELLNSPINIKAMLPDLIARGIDISNIHEKIKGIGYEDLVDLIVENPKIMSWL